MNEKINLNFRSLNKIKNNSKEKIKNVFVEFNENNTDKFNNDNTLDSCLNIIDSSNSEDKIYILSKKLDLLYIKSSLNEAINRGVTFYILLDDGTILQEYFGKVLVRESSKLQDITIIIKEKNNELSGIIAQGNISSKNLNYVLKTDEEQSKDLKRYFVNTFSNNSDFEFRKDGKKNPEKLFENYLYNEILEGNTNIKDKFQEFIDNNTNIHTKYMPYLNYNNIKNSSIQIDKTDLNDLECVKKIGYNNNHLFITDDNSLNSLFFTDDKGFYISDFHNSKNIFIMSLNPSQLKSLKEYENYLNSVSTYRYLKEIELEKLNNNFFFLEKKDINLKRKDKSTIELKTINTETIEEYLNYNLDKQIDSLMEFEPQNIALEYEYTLKVYPPYLPKNAKKDPLINEWKTFSKNFNKLIDDEIQNVKNHIENNNNFFLKIFKSNKWENELKKLCEIKNKYNPSLEYREIEKLFTDFKNITKNNISDKNNIINGMEREKEKIKEHLNEIEKKLSEVKSKNLKLEKDKNKKEREKEALKKNLNVIEKEISDLKQKLSEVKSKNLKLEKDKNEKEREKEALKKNFNVIEKEISNLKQKLSEVKSENLKLEKDKNKTEKEKENIQKDINNINGKKINSNFDISLPTEAINLIGNLYKEGDIRYLAISDIYDLDSAFKEAERLNAKIVSNLVN